MPSSVPTPIRNPRQNHAPAAAALLGLFAASALFAQSTPCPQPHTLSIAQPGYGDAAGAALSFSGATLMIGAPFRDIAGGDAGAVYTFNPGSGTWLQAAQILAPDAAPTDHFGAAVAFNDPYAAIGAPGRGSTGSVYFFQRSGSTWSQMTRVNVTSQAGAEVGRTLAISGTTVAIGVPKKTLGPANEFADAGAVYLYQRNSNGTWGFLQQISEDWQQEPVAGDRLGESLALRDDLLVVGVPTGAIDSPSASHGYVRVYRRINGTFTHEAILSSTPTHANSRYGTSVATDGAYIAVGAPWRHRTAAEGGALTAAGAVFIYRFHNGQWVQDARLLASDASAYATFGSSVALQDGRLIVAAAEARKAYIFRRLPDGIWQQDSILTDPRNLTNGGFAASIAFNGQQLAVGDPSDITFAGTGGLTYLYNRPNFSHSNNCTGAPPISTGSYTGCTQGAQQHGYATCGGTPASQGPDVWFSWNSACSGTLTLDTVGSTFDTVLSVHTGCPGDAGAVQVACNNDAPGLGAASRLQFNYQPYQTYFIRLSGMNGAAGNYTLNVLDGNGNPPANNACSAAQTVTDGSYTFSTCRAGGGSPSVSGCTGAGGSISFQHDVWFRYIAPITGTATVDLCGSNYPAIAAMYRLDHCPSLIDNAAACQIGGCPDGQAHLQFNITQGQQYLIRVGSHNTPGGIAEMTISSTPPAPECPADWNQDSLVNSADISAYITTWLHSITTGATDADFNGDQLINSSDISAFITAWLAAITTGC